MESKTKNRKTKDEIVNPDLEIEGLLRICSQQHPVRRTEHIVQQRANGLVIVHNQ